MGDDQALKQRFLVRAEALSKKPEVFRCQAVTQLICDSVAFGVRAEAEIFQAAYDDPSGRKYWDAHLSEAIPVVSLAYILSVHLAESVESLEDLKFAILCAFRDAAKAGERWFTGETRPLLAVEYGQINFGELGKVKVDPLAAVEWLLLKPKREHLVPQSLRRYLRSSQRHTITNAKVMPGRSPFSPRKRGRKPMKLAQVKAAMMRDIQQGRLTADKLREFLEKDLAATYGVSRDTARRARNEVMSEIA